MFRSRELLPIAGLAALAISVIVPSCQRYNFLTIHNEAASYAVKETGDKKPPLSELEQRVWYGAMHVEEGKEPTKEMILQYIDGCTKRGVVPCKDLSYCRPLEY